MSRMIDADALIELWKGCTFKGDITPIIANAPTIEERKTGRWKRDADGLVWCSTCGFGKERSDERPYRFCPNCGLTMEEGE